MASPPLPPPTLYARSIINPGNARLIIPATETVCRSGAHIREGRTVKNSPYLDLPLRSLEQVLKERKERLDIIGKAQREAQESKGQPG